ncbi:MAG: efflux RND transporter permease subunit [Desulfobacterales bacterium]|nr:efflux RND transporter permease subunit [Desulfobacterales bacterium]
MLISDISIKRPVFATVIMLALVTLGIFSYRRLSIDMWPDVEFPVITITTVLEGAAPETVERELSRRIEESVNTIPGVKHVQSISKESLSLVVVEFQLEVDLNDVAQEARTKINAIRGELPEDIKEPVIQKIDIANMPLISLALRSDTIDSRELTSLVDKKIKHRLENIPGVGKLNLIGTSKREIGIQLRLDRLTALNMGVDEVIGGIQQENLNIPLGRLKQNNAEYPLRITGKALKVSDFKTMVISRRGDRPVLLGEVADIVDGIEEPKTFAFVNAEPAVTIDILKQSGANAVEVVDRIKKAIKGLQDTLPQGVYIEVVRDGSVMIRDSVANVQETIIIGAILTVLIVFLFLNSWRSTVITGLTLPISVISSFIIMNALGMTLNVMTLMALSLAIGLLIDDAIVVRENIVRHLEKDHDHIRAASEGTSEIGLAVLATTFSIIAVFVPVAYMKGIVGRFFFQFGITVAFAVLVSLLVSFTLDPMLSSRWMDPDILGTGKRSWITRLLDHFNRGFDRLAEGYRHVIAWVLDYRKTTLLLALASFIAGIWILTMLQQNFMPIYDQNEFLLRFKSAPNASMEETKSRVLSVVNMLQQYPEIHHTYTTIGAGDWGSVRDAIMYVKLLDKKLRQTGQFELMADIRDKLKGIAGIIPSIEDAGRMDDRKPLLISLRGEDIALLRQYAAKIKQEVARIPKIVDVEMTLEYDIPEYRLAVDRQKATDAGLNSAVIARTIGVLVAGEDITTYEDKEGDAVNVSVRLPEQLRQNPFQLNDLRLVVRDMVGSSALVPLSNIVSYTLSQTPSEINRYDLLREVVVSANLDQLPLGTAMQQSKVITDRISKELPPGYRILFYGESEDMVESFGYMMESLILAIIFVYLILAAQFESFLHPFAIMLSLPLSIVGMVGMLKITGDTINIMSLIGLILLMGLVTKNAILLVDYANVLRNQGMERKQALITAGRTRLRPIIMTTLAMIFGMLPLALALGAGSEMHAPMARAVIGGLITSTLLTLLVVPVVYTLLEDLKNKFKGRPAIAVMLLFFFLLPRDSFGEEKPKLIISLTQAVSIALQNNIDMLKAREAQDKVQGFYLEQRAAALPQMTMSSFLTKENDKSQKALGGEGMDMPTDRRFNALEAKISQVIFTWGQVSAAIRGAKSLISATAEEFTMIKQATIRDVSIAFYDILLAKEMHTLALQNISQKQRHLDEARKKFSAGTATDYDVLAAEVALNNAKPEAIQAENAIVIALEHLFFLLGTRDEIQDITGNLDVNVTAYPLFEETFTIAQQNRPEINFLKRQLEVAIEKVIINRGLNKPRVDFQSYYGYRDLTLGKSSADGDAWSLGIYLTYPFYDGEKTQGLSIQAESELKSLQLDIKKIHDTLILQVREAVHAVKEAGEIVQALTGTVSQAEKLLFMAEKGYEYGAMTRLNVEDAELNLKQSRSNLAKGRRDYLASCIKLSWVMGIIE